MNHLSILIVVSLAALGFAFAWDTTRNQLAAARETISALEAVREADNEALSRLRFERDEISRRYEGLSKELAEIEDEPTVEYLSTPVPPSVRRLLER